MSVFCVKKTRPLSDTYFLGLLRDKQRQLEIVDAECSVVELIYVRKEANMFGSSFCKRVFGHCEV